MAKSINQVILMGNLTRDPELRTTPGGNSVCSFGLAVNRSYTGQDGTQQDAVDYFDIVAWGKLGELVNQYLQKGRRCLIQGRLSYRAWEQDGQKRSKVEIVANDVTFLDGPGQTTSDSGASSAPSSSQTRPSKKDQDIVIEDIDDKPIDLSEIPF